MKHIDGMEGSIATVDTPDSAGLWDRRVAWFLEPKATPEVKSGLKFYCTVTIYRLSYPLQGNVRA